MQKKKKNFINLCKIKTSSFFFFFSPLKLILHANTIKDLILSDRMRKKKKNERKSYGKF